MKAFALLALPLLVSAAVKIYDTIDLTNMEGLTPLPLAPDSSSAPAPSQPIDCYPRPAPGDRKIIEENYRKAEAKWNASVVQPLSDDGQASNYGNGLLNQYNFCSKFVVVPVHFVSVFYDDGTNSRANGYFTDDQVYSEMNMLYLKLNLRGVYLQLAAVHRYKFTTKAAWEAYKIPATNERTEAIAISQLVRGNVETRSVKDLYIYSVFQTSAGNAGFASIPDSFATDNRMVKSDGVFVGHEFLFGGGNYMQGLLSHEIGHWLNLYHTFETYDATFGCGGSGDYVSDTIPWLSYDGGKDHAYDFTLCPGVGGFKTNEYVDPCPNHNPSWISKESLRAAATNVMSYSNDDCRERFTPGQIKRIMVSLSEFRGYDYGC